MNRIYYRIMCIILACMFLMSGAGCTFFNCFADEGLTDSQLYGYGEENVLGHSKKKTSSSHNDKVISSKEVITDKAGDDSEKGKDLKAAEDISTDSSNNLKSIKVQKDESSAEAIQREEPKEIDVKIIGVEDNYYYNDELDISVDVSGLSDSDNVDAVVLRKTFDGNTMRHNMIINKDNDTIHSEEKINEEGEYSLDVQVSRGVNVLKHLNRSFVFDMTPPQFNEDMFNKMSKEQIDVAYLISNSFTDDSPCETVAEVNNNKVEGGIIKDEGEYDITLKATDKAGNVSSISKNMHIKNVQEKTPVKQNMYHQLIGATLLVGSSLLYFERKKFS